MSASAFSRMLILLSFILVIIGTGTIFVDRPLMSLCQQCGVNSILLGLFGEAAGKWVLVLIWYLLAAYAARVAVQIRRKHKQIDEDIGQLR